MAPSLRSAVNTPESKSRASNESPSTTPRKVPHCTQCKRPRAGHPRSGCPYVDSPQKSTPALNTTDATIADALGSMHIASPSPGRDEETKAKIRDRRRASMQPPVQTESLASISSEALANMLFPTEDDDEEAGGDAKRKRNNVVRWQDALRIPDTPGRVMAKKETMPCSLITPSPESSFEKEESVAQTAAPSLSSSGSSSSASSTTSKTTASSAPTIRPQPLARSMSIQEREIFVSSLTRASDATVYVVPKADIYSVQASATKIGFHARVVVNPDDHDSQGLLILGREEKAVMRLFDLVDGERTKGQKTLPGRGGGLRAAAGGAVVGAVGAWAGLAFS